MNALWFILHSFGMIPVDPKFLCQTTRVLRDHLVKVWGSFSRELAFSPSLHIAQGSVIYVLSYSHSDNLCLGHGLHHSVPFILRSKQFGTRVLHEGPYVALEARVPDATPPAACCHQVSSFRRISPWKCRHLYVIGTNP